MQVGRNFWLIMLLFAGSLAAASIWGDTVYYRMCYALGIMILLSFFWTWINQSRIRIIRKNRYQRLELGQIFEEQFEVINHSILPNMWIVIEDQSAIPGHHGSRAIPWVGSRKQILYHTDSILSRMGNYRLGPTKITTGDIFGIFSWEHVFPETGSLLVFPHMVRLRKFPSPTGMLSGGKPSRQKSIEVTPYAAGVREYAMGDALNRIHWPSTFRHNRMMVKEFERDPQADVWILVDTEKSVQAEMNEFQEVSGKDWIWFLAHRHEFKLYPSTLEYASSCAASIAKYYIEQGMAVGFCCQEKKMVALPPERGERQLGKILENLTFLEGKGRTPIYSLSEAQVQNIRQGSIVIIITPTNNYNIVISSEEMMKRKMQPVMILIDAATFSGRSGTEALQDQCQIKNIPVFRIEKDKPIENMLIQEAQFSEKPWWKIKQIP